jgi:hypothetical protein
MYAGYHILGRDRWSRMLGTGGVILQQVLRDKSEEPNASNWKMLNKIYDW